MEQKIVEVLGKFASTTEYNDLPQAVARQAKRCLLDLIGCGLAGYKTTPARIILKSIKKINCKEEATVFGSRDKFSCLFATLVNGTMAHELEFDHGHRTGHQHPGVTTVPAVLAVGEKFDANGKDLISSITLGYDVAIRIGKGLSPSVLSDRSFHPAGLIGAFGAAAAASKILRLDEDGIADALGLCCITPVAVHEAFQTGSMAKDLYGGWPGFVGVFAALLAKDGFTGPRSIIEGDGGLAKNVTRSYDLRRILEGLGKNYQILQVYFKPYPCCRALHPAVEASLEISKKHKVNPEDIKKIELHTYSVAARANNPEPRTPIEARYSLPYVVALALAEGRIGINHFSEKNIHNEQLLNLSRKVRISVDPLLERLYDEKWPVSVEVFTKDGKKYFSRVDLAKGEPETPMTDDELRQKFIALASRTITKEKANEIVKRVSKIEELSNVAEMTKLFQAT